MIKSDLISIRGLLPGDLGFIYSTWIQGYQGGHAWFRKIPRKLFWEKYRPLIEILLQKRDIKVACLKAEPDVIVGYCVYKDTCIDWVHVKENWRKIGIAQDLVPANYQSVSHLTNVGFHMIKKHPHVIYNPFL